MPRDCKAIAGGVAERLLGQGRNQNQAEQRRGRNFRRFEFRPESGKSSPSGELGFEGGLLVRVSKLSPPLPYRAVCPSRGVWGLTTWAPHVK